MDLRGENLERLDGGRFDAIVVGGGINGAVAAAALSSRGLSVALLEGNDFGSFTSQESSNLVWGGFRYLENYEIPLVMKLCRSRNRLMRAYPNVIGELRFLATLDDSAPFPAWLAGLGTVGYWLLGSAATKRPRFHRPERIARLEPIVRTDTAEAGVEYGDGYLKDNDARFVWSFVRAAIDRGAVAANYTAVTDATPTAGGWRVTALDHLSGRELSFHGRVVVNAAGPFVDCLNCDWGVTTKHRIVYSKGIHLVVPQLTSSERVLAFFDDTARLFYVIPMANRSVIGTTDTRTDDASEGVSDDDRRFLLEQINARLDLASPLTVDDVIAERCGVRPLVVPDDGSDRRDVDWTALSRKHEIEVDAKRSIITIFGGKLTDCLNVGDEVAEAVAGLGIELGPAGQWYGEAPAEARRAFLRRASKLGLRRPPSVEREPSIGDVLWRRHGPAAEAVLDAIADDPGAAEEVLAESDILRGELAVYADREMIVNLDDFLRRRTKLAMLHRAADLTDDPGMAEVTKVLGVAQSV